MNGDGGDGGSGGWEGTSRVAQEAIRLLQALAETGSGDHGGPSAHGLASGWGDGASEQAPECRICPICRVIAAIRQARPEAMDQVITAAAELAAALRELALPQGAPGPTASASGTTSASGTASTSAPGQASASAHPDGVAASEQAPDVQQIEITD